MIRKAILFGVAMFTLVLVNRALAASLYGRIIPEESNTDDLVSELGPPTYTGTIVDSRQVLAWWAKDMPEGFLPYEAILYITLYKDKVYLITITPKLLPTEEWSSPLGPAVTTTRDEFLDTQYDQGIETITDIKTHHIIQIRYFKPLIVGTHG